MPSETWSPSPTQLHKSLESLKQTFKQRLDAILDKQLTVENIGIFADEALEQTVKLTEEVLKEYRENPKVYPNQIPLDKQKQEDEAFKILDLPNISEILQLIIKVKEKIDTLGKYISESNIFENKVLIPPQHNLVNELQTGNGQGVEEKRLIPRLLTLFYILEADFDIKKEQIKITQGKVIPEMMRQTPYVRIEIDELERIIYICDEEGNASYVFDTDKLEENGIKAEDLDIADKSAINDLIIKHPGIGYRIIQAKHWRTNMVELLGNPIPENSTTSESTRQPVSEFVKKEKKEFLPFDKFQAEVRTLYPDMENISKWYKIENLKYKNWPSNPDIFYKDLGWIGWPELVGRENRMKKEYLSFEFFKVEVRTLYKGESNVQRWYLKEKLKHEKWTSRPNVIYRDQGWKSWGDLVGK